MNSLMLEVDLLDAVSITYESLHAGVLVQTDYWSSMLNVDWPF